MKFVFYHQKRSVFSCVKKPVISLDFSKIICYDYIVKEGINLKFEIDFDNLTDENVYTIFGVDGNESEALNDIYLELFELLGKESMLKIYKHYHGDKLDLPMRLYRHEFVADLAKPEKDRRERAKIARAGGYTAKSIENFLNKRKKEDDE